MCYLWFSYYVLLCYDIRVFSITFIFCFFRVFFFFFFFKQKTAYEMRISDWSSDVCSSDLAGTQLRPFVVIAGVTAHVTHRVDRTGTAEYATTRPPKPPPVERRHRCGAVIPVDALATDQLGDAGGHMNKWVPIARAGFQQQHFHRRVGAQPDRKSTRLNSSH